MVWKPGTSGNPSGRVQDKPWSEALRVAVNERGADGKKLLRRLAELTVQRALDGDMEAVREIGNRLDGRAVQRVDVGIEDTADTASIIAQFEAAAERARLSVIQAGSLSGARMIEGESEPAPLPVIPRLR